MLTDLANQVSSEQQSHVPYRIRREAQTSAHPQSALYPASADLSLLFCLTFCHSTSLHSSPPPSTVFFFFCRIEFPPILQLFHRYVELATRQDISSSCFGRVIVDVLPLCSKILFFWEKPVWQYGFIRKAYREPISTLNLINVILMLKNRDLLFISKHRTEVLMLT